MNTNHLYYGDNLDILERYIKDESIDLVYLDPPFKSNQDFNILFAEQNGSQSQAQIKAFEDTWRWDQGAVQAYENVVEAGGKVSQVMQAFRTFFGGNDMMAYLAMMAPRLKEFHRVMKNTASIFLHCDPTASHYLKMLMDAVFGAENYRNEIIWRRTGAHGGQRSFGPIHDTLFFFSKTSDYFFQVLKRPYMRKHVERRYTLDTVGRYKFTSGGNVLSGAGVTKGESGAEWRGFDPSKKNRHWAIPGFLSTQMPPSFAKLGVLDKLETLYEKGLIEIREGSVWPTPVRYLKKEDGHPLQDIWSYQPYTEGTVFRTEKGIDQDVAWLGPTAPERLSYPTQKPEGLLERIITSACPDEGVVLDPFCGCGTTVVVAQKLRRKWIGIDITPIAVTLMKHRLQSMFGNDVTYEVTGEPVTLPDAETLAKQDRHDFQLWALGLVRARPATIKRGADKGIDGKIYFHDSPDEPTRQIILSVKSGHVSVKDVRELRAVTEREKAVIGVLITLEKPTKPMKNEAVSLGFYKSAWNEKYPRLQILTIADLLKGKQILYSPYRVDKTYRLATKVEQNDIPPNGELFEE